MFLIVVCYLLSYQLFRFHLLSHSFFVSYLPIGCFSSLPFPTIFSSDWFCLHSGSTTFFVPDKGRQCFSEIHWARFYLHGVWRNFSNLFLILVSNFSSVFQNCLYFTSLWRKTLLSSFSMLVECRRRLGTNCTRMMPNGLVNNLQSETVLS